VSADPHRPTTAGPTPESASGLPPGAVAAGTTGGDDGGGLPLGIPADKPEFLVGAAFAGGVLAALVLKRLGGG
jgi:hypothetical protein